MREELVRRYGERLPLLTETARKVQAELEAILDGLPRLDRVTVRAKSLKSFIEKALDRPRKEPYSDPLTEIEDQVAARVIVFFRDDMGVVRDRLLSNFNKVERKLQEPQADAEFGYESEHLIVHIPPHLKAAGWTATDDLPQTMEFQIRTVFMHAYAAPYHYLGYKGEVELPREIRRELSWVAASAWGADHAYSRVWQWVSAAKRSEFEERQEDESPEGGSPGQIT